MASNNPTEDELAPETTEGFKVGEKKTIDEYQQLGKEIVVCNHSTQDAPFRLPAIGNVR